MLQAGTGEKREPWSLLSREFEVNQLTTQATATSAWWILPNVALARIHIKLFIQTFLLPLPQYQTALSCQFSLPRRGTSHLQEPAASQTARKILEIQITVSQMRLRRGGHTSLTRKTSTIWSETKCNAELLTSKLKQWNLLDESVQVTDQRKRHQTFSYFFSRQDELCFCNNVVGLFEASKFFF